MAESIVSAVQSSVFEKSKMPSFKTSSLSLSSSINDVYSSISRSLSDKEKGKVFFTYSDDNSSNEDSSKDNNINSSSSSSSSSSSINNDSNADDDAKQKKISSLAEMMMRESRRLYDDNSNTNKNDDNDAKEDDDLQGLLKRCVSINDGTNLARALASLPPNVLNPNSYSDIITNISITHGIVNCTIILLLSLILL
jgi:leucyl aminopeptidase